MQVLSLAKNKLQDTVFLSEHWPYYNFAGLFCASLSITLDANHWVNVLIQGSFVFDCKLGEMVVFMNSDHYGKHVTLHQGKIESDR
jgi:hypothetical protein